MKPVRLILGLIWAMLYSTERAVKSDTVYIYFMICLHVIGVCTTRGRSLGSFWLNVGTAGVWSDTRVFSDPVVHRTVSETAETLI